MFSWVWVKYWGRIYGVGLEKFSFIGSLFVSGVFG